MAKFKSHYKSDDGETMSTQTEYNFKLPGDFEFNAPQEVTYNGKKFYLVRSEPSPVLTLANLEKCFETAKKVNSRFVAIRVTVPGGLDDEIIINPSENFDSKLEYYKKAYNENLELLTFNKIRIVGFVHADNYNDIEDMLAY